MPAVRGIYTTNPNTGLEGLWLSLSTDPPGILVGMAKSVWPTTAGKTLVNYQAELQGIYQALCNLPGQPTALIFGQQPPAGYIFDSANHQLIPMVVIITLTVQSPLPALNTDVVLSSVVVSNGACRSMGVGA